MDDDLEQVVARERALLDPVVRRDTDRALTLLHPDFVEFGASGRIWDRSSIVAALGGDPRRIVVTDMTPRRLGPDAVLLTYRATEGGRSTLRSSTWIRDRGLGWVLLFHQGTPID